MVEDGLRQLVKQSYPGDVTGLRSVAHYTFEDRKILRCDFRDRPPGLLRAFTGDVESWLLHQAEVLLQVEAAGFPAPRLIATIDGAQLARLNSWTGLMLTFIEGEQADRDPATLEDLGELAGCLHRIDVPGNLGPALKAPPSQETSKRQLAQLEESGPVPESARSFHRAALEVWRGLVELDGQLECLVHGDCWPDNAIRTPSGNLVLIDWEGTGRGFAIIELGYLLLSTSFASSPTATALVANRPGIEAVVRGYARQRCPSDEELSWLPNALRFDIVRRAIAMDAFSLDAPGWANSVWLNKTLARDAICDKVAAIAQETFSHLTA